MPLPQKDEKQDDYISRCMGDAEMNAKHADEKQRAAVCHSYWRDKTQKSFTAEIVKADADQNLVFGWASVIEKADGTPVVDSQGDVWMPDELEKSAYKFVLEVRKAGEMHRRIEGVGDLVESVVLTKQKREAMGLPPGPTGWWVGFKIAPDVMAKVKSGDYSAFSIGGRGLRKEIKE